MSQPIQPSNMDPENQQHALIAPPCTNLQLQPNAFAQGMSTTQGDWAMKTPTMNQDCVLLGLEAVPPSFVAPHLYKPPNPAAHAGVMPSFTFPTVGGLHHQDSFKDGGGYMMQPPHLAASSGFQSVMIDGFRQMQQQQVSKEGANGRGSTPARKTQRMIKNRESAARSRARKQAYTAQLETDVQTLKEENNMLRENLKLIEEGKLILTNEEKRQRTIASAEL